MYIHVTNPRLYAAISHGSRHVDMVSPSIDSSDRGEGGNYLVSLCMSQLPVIRTSHRRRLP